MSLALVAKLSVSDWLCRIDPTSLCHPLTLELADDAPNLIRNVFYRVGGVLEHLHEVLAFNDLGEAVALLE